MDGGPELLPPESRLPWPLIAIDFEASALGPRSYPIEVGLARWTAPDAPIEVWSTLIRPTAGWIEGGVWSECSEAIHGIRQNELEAGISPVGVIANINEIAARHTAWCDGGSDDRYWLATLAHAAGTDASFQLGDWDALGGALTSNGYERMVRWHDQAVARHRAGGDAELLLRAVAVGLGRTDVATLALT